MSLFQQHAGDQSAPAIAPRLHWLAEQAAPFTDPHGTTCQCCPRGGVPAGDVFVTEGDAVVLASGSCEESTGVIVGADGSLPIVRYTTGPLAGREQTVDPDQIVAAILLKRMRLW
jgi:hypothetical protein